MKKILVSFVGGRPLPNIQQVLSLKPDAVHFVVSKDSMGKNGNYEKLLAALPPGIEPIPHEVAPYVMPETESACQAILTKYVDDEVLFHLGSAPTTMSLAAYRVAQANNKTLIYSFPGGVMDIFNDTQRPVTIALVDYFRAYGWKVSLQQDADEVQAAAAEWMARNIAELNSLLQQIRQENPSADKLIRLNAQEGFYSLLEKLAEYNVISRLNKLDGNMLEFSVPLVSLRFIMGIWLEIYVYQVARRLSVFDECAWDISDGERQGQLDFCGIFSGQLLIASCKVISNIIRTPFDELVTRGKQLGSGMCTKVFVTNIIPSEQERKKTEKWCKEREIVPVFGDDLSNLGNVLEAQVKDPQYRRV
jgi:hypothetical protein